MTELVKIVVELADGQKVDNTLLIKSDGSYVEVNRRINEIVSKAAANGVFKSKTISKVYWVYA